MHRFRLRDGHPQSDQFGSWYHGCSTEHHRKTAKDNQPKSSDRAKYHENYFELDGDIVVSGTSASFPVKIGSYTSEATTVKQWKAEKVGDQWLLSETPLP